MGAFETLSALNVNDHTEQKNGLTYLTWSWAWDEVKRKYPEAEYSIWKNENGLPYVYDPLTGFMVYTSVTIEGITHEMWLPVMDGSNKAMKAEAYQYTVRQHGKEVTKTCQAASMFDINKTIMRCLVKNLAMFGLGLYIYAGEDLPEVDKEEKQEEAKKEEVKQQKLEKENPAVAEADLRVKVLAFVNRHQMSPENIQKICNRYKVASLNEMTIQHCRHYIAQLEKAGGNINE